MIDNEIVVGILTGGRLFPKRKDLLKNTWMRHWPQSSVVVVSDGFPHGEDLEDIDYVVATDDNGKPCGDRKGDLCCKDIWLYKHYYEDPKYKNAKWFLRVVDDTWVFKPNLIKFLESKDPNEVHYIGQRMCWEYERGTAKLGKYHREPVDMKNETWELVCYADGGAGWIISRKVLEDINNNWEKFHYVCKLRTWDDVVFGWLMQLLYNDDIRLCEYPGQMAITQNAPDLKQWKKPQYFCANRDKPLLWHHPHQGQNKRPKHDMVETEALFHDEEMYNHCKTLDRARGKKSA
eukprot:CAMPEP_0168511118 /NCGR_PEP_ID=MMETSP0405-20121227/1916_1 /TAXON_ID=498012 /ORGANISM="Trichosphaerium sp, Strain Am-I-7 wt" /LENGTH=290 /DNA_ID=CAMNT_0008529177 /DNA_START=105 /DNA_END=977 /DNA_ORIENTATION=+